MTQDYSDQTKFFDPQTWIEPIHLIGAGGICNMLGITLSKMGITQEIHVWDDDELETRNCPTEVAYSYQMVGQPKVVAMADSVRYVMGDVNNIIQHHERITIDSDLSGVVISGVDSMASRKIIWDCVQQHFLEIPLYIDGRSGGLITQIFALSPADYDQCENYANWLFDDEDAMPLECGARNYPPAALYFAYAISNLLAKWHRGEDIKFYTKAIL